MEKNQVNNVEEMAQEQSFLQKNWKKVCAGVAAVVLVIVACIAYVKLVSEPREVAASDAIAACQTQIAEQQYKEAVPALQAVVDQYGSTKAGNLAQAYLGIAYYNLGQYADAIKALEKYDANDAFIEAQVEQCLGNCYACTKEYDKAVSKLESAAKKADNEVLAAACLIQAGEICLSQGNKEKALALYQQVKDNYKSAAGDIDKYIERAKN